MALPHFVVVLAITALTVPCRALIVKHNFDAGMKPFSYQTFSGVAMYSEKDAPSRSKPGNGHSYIEFDLELERSKADRDAFLELIVIPDININDIGVKKNGNLHLCCNVDLLNQYGCTEDHIGELIIPKNIRGLYREKIALEGGSALKRVKTKAPVQVTAIHVFALSSCDSNLQISETEESIITFSGTTRWMNPYGHLPGDVYGYLPFYGWMCIIYLVISIIWFCFNAIYWNELLHVQNCITGVLAMCLIEMATWYFHYLHLNNIGVVHHGPFVLGLITTCSRRMVSRMLVLAVSLGYGVVKPTLHKVVKNKVVMLGVVYWIFAFMFESLIHYNQTEKVESWMRVILIPPVAIINGIFWWWTFVSLNKTIEQLKIRRQSAKLQLYKSFTLVLVITLIAAITFAIYEMYYVLKELYFAQWQKLWFMEVGFWQILFSSIFITIMILWRPSEHFKRYAYYNQGTTLDVDNEYGGREDDELDEAAQFNAPDTFADHITKRRPDTAGHDEEDGGNGPTAKFAIDDGNDEEEEDAVDDNKPKTTLAQTIDIADAEHDRTTKID
eukprot:CAMPEP_0197031360 /NCGR_PEP_ID=MMETSP1384-20130603/10389_1 /TAXON_ID=29189 /ORGANISM="Ammonia sp." /LENGTH=556 /DNA_ID=CAMNT_0042460877 /DNA_START=34 /DNA_END=1704 /DNA_ORIENTATION=-